MSGVGLSQKDVSIIADSLNIKDDLLKKIDYREQLVERISELDKVAREILTIIEREVLKIKFGLE